MNNKLDIPNAYGYNWATLFQVEINTGTWPSGLRKSQILDSKIWSWALRESDPGMTALARPRSNYKLQTHSLVMEGTPHKKEPQMSTGNWKEKNLVAGPRWVPDTKTDWPNDRKSSYKFDLTFMLVWVGQSWVLS
jgi:hypothetical protein